MPWFILQTKPNCEKKAAEKLKVLGIDAYCPVKIEVKQWSDRKKKIKLPLLPSMILINCRETERNLVFNVSLVKQYLFWLGKPAVATQKEVEALRSLETQNYGQCNLETIKKGDVIDLSPMGLKREKGVVKYVSSGQCWVVLDSLGYVVKLQLQPEQ